MTLIFNSAIAFALAFTLTTILHEMAHAAAGLALARGPILYASHVEYRHATMPLGEAVCAAAGPLFSLLQGLVLLALWRFTADKSDGWRLLVLWLALHGLVNFFGYLLTTPFVPDADLGLVAQTLGWPAIARYAAFALGIAGIVGTGYLAARPFLQIAPAPELIASESARAAYMMNAAVWPWLAGALLLLLFNWPAPHWLSVLYIFASGLFTLNARDFARAIQTVEAGGGDWQQSVLWPNVGALLVLLFVYRFILTQGIRLG